MTVACGDVTITGQHILGSLCTCAIERHEAHTVHTSQLRDQTYDMTTGTVYYSIVNCCLYRLVNGRLVFINNGIDTTLSSDLKECST